MDVNEWNPSMIVEDHSFIPKWASIHVGYMLIHPKMFMMNVIDSFSNNIYLIWMISLPNNNNAIIDFYKSWENKHLQKS